MRNGPDHLRYGVMLLGPKFPRTVTLMKCTNMLRGPSKSEACQFNWTFACATGRSAMHVIGWSGERLDIHPNVKPTASFDCDYVYPSVYT